VSRTVPCSDPACHPTPCHPTQRSRTHPPPNRLQTRNGKRTGVAALRVAIEMEQEGLVTADEAVLMVEPRHLDQLLHPMFVNEKVCGLGG